MGRKVEDAEVQILCSCVLHKVNPAFSHDKINVPIQVSASRSIDLPAGQANKGEKEECKKISGIGDDE